MNISLNLNKSKEEATAEEEYEGFNLLSWSPLTEVYDDLPTFSANA